MPEQVEECVKSVLEDNPDYSESRAYAICNAKNERGELENVKAPAEIELDDDPCWEGYTMVGTKTDENGNEVPRCVPDDDVPDAEMAHAEESDCPDGKVSINGSCVDVTEIETPPSMTMSAGRVLSNRHLRGPIEREELDDGSVAYRNIKILTEGIWTDSNSQEPIHYIPDNLDLADDNTVNLIHDTDNEVSEVGRMENASTEDNAKYVDVILHRDNAASEYADENLQKALETNGRKGFGGPSVEIPSKGQEITPDGPQGYPALSDGVIDGLGLVGNQADKNVGFEQQTRNRAVALADGQTHKVYTLQDDSMSVKSLRESLTEHGFDLEEKDDESIKSLAESLGLMDEEEEEEEEDMPEEMEEGGDDDEEDMEEEEMDMMDPEEMMDELEELRTRIDEMESEMMGDYMSELEEAQSELSQATEELSETRSELAELREEKKELAEQVEEQDKRLSDIESQEKEPKTLADGDSDGWEPNYDTLPSESSGW